MKRIIASLLISLSTIGSFAQSEFDALKYTQTDINGTARYMGMAGAFGALGGDASAISINPAGLGIYRSSEFAFTSGLIYNQVNTELNGVSATDNNYKVPLNNMSYIINFGGDTNKKSGLVNSSFGITFNKLKNFNRNIYIKGGPQNTSMTDYMAGFSNGLTVTDLTLVDSTGYDPCDVDYIPWLSVLAFEAELIDTVDTDYYWESLLKQGENISPDYSLTESGYINEWNFSYAANISNRIYIGASLGIQDIKYSRTSIYSEDFFDGGGFDLTNHFITYGSGINFKIGTILRPFDFLRLGAALHTPTFLSLTDEYNAYVESTIGSSETPLGGSYYKIQGPMQTNLSAALIVGKIGLLSVDYGFTNYTSITIRDDNNLSAPFVKENQGIANYLQDTHTLKIGTEIRINDNFSLRAGYGLATPATNNSKARKELPENTMRTDPEYFLDQNTKYSTIGFGYREGNCFFDFAYMQRNQSQDFYAYNLNGASKATVNNSTNNFIATLGFRF